tara:strand:+ start:2610 stop:5357 length:2748 start_codon:yes stop_codon:yes gene_type:complete
MAKVDECVKVITQAIGDSLNASEKKKVIKEVEDLIKREKNQLKGAALEKKVMEHIQESEINAAKELYWDKLNTIKNEQIFTNIVERLEPFLHTGSKNSNKYLGLRALLVGGQKGDMPGIRLSIDAQSAAYFKTSIGKLLRLMEIEKVDAEFRTGAIDREIMQELYEMKPGGRSGISGNKSAEKIARIIHEIQSDMLRRMRAAGAIISERPDYIMTQSHDAIGIRRAGFDEWYNFILGKLDQEMTFKDLDPDVTPKEFLQSVYNYLTTNQHYSSYKIKKKSNNADKTMYNGPGNLAKRLSEKHRQIHFKDADSFYEYNQKFGRKNIRETLVTSFEWNARNIALLESLGTNPKNMLQRLLTRYTDEARAVLERSDLTPKERKRAEKNLSQLQSAAAALSESNQQNFFNAAWLEVSGYTRQAAGAGSAAQISATLRSIQNITKLGSATVSAVADVPAQHMELRYQGVHPFQRTIQPFLNIVKGRGWKASERRDIAFMHGVGIDGVMGTMAHRFDPGGQATGYMTWAQTLFFKLNMLSYWTDAHRAGMINVLAAHLGKNSKKKFTELPVDVQRSMRQYNIDELEWDLVRKSMYISNEKSHTNQNFTKYITIDGVKNKVLVTDEDIVAYLKLKTGQESASAAQIQRVRDDISGRLSAYYVDRADYGVPMAGGFERTIMQMGTQDGTPLGTALRLMMQFKSFGITILNRGMGRNLMGYGAESRTQALGKFNSINAVAMSTLLSGIFGYISLSLYAYTRGKEPKQFMDWDEKDAFKHNANLFFESLLKGGGWGIYGDFLFNQWNDTMRSFSRGIVGPTISQLDDVFSGIAKALRGESPAGEIADLAKYNTPFIGLFYTKMLVDYLILYNLMEMANPGSLRKKEKRQRKKYKQDYLVRPSQVIPRGGTYDLTEILEGLKEQMD